MSRGIPLNCLQSQQIKTSGIAFVFPLILCLPNPNLPKDSRAHTTWTFLPTYFSSFWKIVQTSLKTGLIRTSYLMCDACDMWCPSSFIRCLQYFGCPLLPVSDLCLPTEAQSLAGPGLWGCPASSASALLQSSPGLRHSRITLSLEDCGVVTQA